MAEMQFKVGLPTELGTLGLLPFFPKIFHVVFTTIKQRETKMSHFQSAPQLAQMQIQQTGYYHTSLGKHELQYSTGHDSNRVCLFLRFGVMASKQ